MNPDKYTTIQISLKNREIIAKATKYGESLNDGLTRLFKKANLQDGKAE